MPILEAVMDDLREQGVKEFGAVGFCFGARYLFDVAFTGAIKVGAIAHPSFLKVPDDVEKIKESGIPMLFM